MLMKKHIIVALISVLTLAIAAPAFAANVNGSLNFGYNMENMTAVPPTAQMGLGISGNVSENVSAGIGFATMGVAEDGITNAAPGNMIQNWWPALSEAWIQAKATPFGTVKLGAFDMNFGEGNDTAWLGFPEYSLNGLISNEIGGANVSGGVAIDHTGNLSAAGAAASVQPVDALNATVGILALDSTGWQPAVGYNVSYTGIENMGLGLRGNIQNQEMIASAAYQLMPEVKISGEYGKANVTDTILNAGINGTFGKLHAGADYASTNGAATVSVNGGYDFELTSGLTVGLNGKYDITHNTSTLGASAGVSF